MSRKLVFHPGKILAILFSVIFLLVILHLGLQYLQSYGQPGKLTFFVNLFNLDNETSFPTWFSQFLLLLAAFIAFIISFSKRATIIKYSLQWKLVAAVLLFLSIDEVATIHEQLIGVVSRNKVEVGLAGVGSWYIYAALLIGIVVIFLFKLWWSLPRRTKMLLVLAVVTYVLGAVVTDSFSGAYVGQGFIHTGLWIALEEGLEMSGVALIIYALLDYAKTQKILTRVSFGEPDA